MNLEEPRFWIQRHYRSFNGLRGTAVLLVFANHYGQLIIPRSAAMALWPGVDLFFVLSGFLITGILLDSQGAATYFRDFYVRRALRIFPLYYGFFLVVALLIKPFHLVYQPIVWTNLAYVSNLARLHPEIANPTVFNFAQHSQLQIGLGTFWSLCVEEQFYLFWPGLVRMLQSRAAIMKFCTVAIAFSLCLRIGLYLQDSALVASSRYLYFWTPTRCDGLFIGSWIAAWLRGQRLTRRTLHRIAYASLGFAIPLLLVGSLTIGRRWVFDEVNPLLCTYGYTLIDLVGAGILLLSLDDSTFISRFFRNPFLVATGSISYGFYIFHGVYVREFMVVAARYSFVPHIGLAAFAAGLVLSWALAWVSFHYFEAPFLRLKDTFAPTIQHQPEPLISSPRNLSA